MQPIEPKFKVGDRVRRKVVDPHNPATEYIYTVFEIENDKYCLDHNDHESWIPISYQDSLELVEEPEPKLKPKFKVGDKVQCGWSDEIFTIKMVDDYGYRLNNNMFVDFPDEKSLSLVVEEPQREHKFILGDIVVHVKHGVYGDRYFIQRIDDDCYIAYPYGVGGDLSDQERKIWYDEEDEWELFSNAVKMSIKPEPKLKFDDDLNEIPYIDTLWKDTLANMVTDITKRNADSFVGRIDETLRYMDCDAYVEDARAGMRQFAKELKKRLGYD